MPETAKVKRVTSRLTTGSEIGPGSYRRVYQDLRVQEIVGFDRLSTAIWKWREITDEDYEAAGLETPDEYKGE